MKNTGSFGSQPIVEVITQTIFLFRHICRTCLLGPHPSDHKNNGSSQEYSPAAAIQKLQELVSKQLLTWPSVTSRTCLRIPMIF